MILKYRAYAKRLDRVVEVTVIDFEEQEVQLLVGRDGGLTSAICVPFDDIVLMQSTGLFDKNGVEIFEGDVVRYGSSSYDSFVCGWSEEEPALRAISKIELLELTFWKDETEDWEVIGNVYENPELVENA